MSFLISRPDVSHHRVITHIDSKMSARLNLPTKTPKVIFRENCKTSQIEFLQTPHNCSASTTNMLKRKSLAEQIADLDDPTPRGMAL